MSSVTRTQEATYEMHSCSCFVYTTKVCTACSLACWKALVKPLPLIRSSQAMWDILQLHKEAPTKKGTWLHNSFSMHLHRPPSVAGMQEGNMRGARPAGGAKRAQPVPHTLLLQPSNEMLRLPHALLAPKCRQPNMSKHAHAAAMLSTQNKWQLVTASASGAGVHSTACTCLAPCGRCSRVCKCPVPLTLD